MVFYDMSVSGKNIIMHMIFFGILFLYTLWLIFKLKTIGLVSDSLDKGSVRKRLYILEAGSIALNFFVAALPVTLIFYGMFHDRMPLLTE